MDLQAYANIEILQDILKELDVIPDRLRGLRLMQFETPYTQEDIEEAIKMNNIEWVVQKLTCTWWPYKWHKGLRGHYETQTNTDYKGQLYTQTYFITDSINLNDFHGKKRKQLKFRLKKETENVIKQMEMFNQFAGKKVLSVHTRIGGPNRLWYNMNEVQESKYWLGDVDDYFDSTYCDIYFDISHVDIEKYIKNEEGK